MKSNNGASNGKYSSSTGVKSDSDTKIKKTDLPDWRMKREGDTKIMDGKTWHWCTHHKLDGVFDGLYMTHAPCDHE